jgi:hypothetical protein
LFSGHMSFSSSMASLLIWGEGCSPLGVRLTKLGRALSWLSEGRSPLSSRLAWCLNWSLRTLVSTHPCRVELAFTLHLSLLRLHSLLLSLSFLSLSLSLLLFSLLHLSLGLGLSHFPPLLPNGLSVSGLSGLYPLRLSSDLLHGFGLSPASL